MRTLFVRRLSLRVFTLCVVAMCIGPHSSALASHSVGSETKMLWVNDSGTKAFGWVTIWGDAAEEYESRHHWVIYGASGKRLVSGGRGVLLEVSYIVLPEFCDLKLTQLMRTPDTADHYLEDWVWDTAPPFLSPEDYEFAGKGAPPTPDQSPWLRDLLKRHSLNHPLVMRRRSADDMIWFSCVEILDPDSDEEDEDEEDEDE